MNQSFSTLEEIKLEGILKEDKRALWYEKKYKGRLGDIMFTSKRIIFNSYGNPFAGALLKLLFKKEDSGIKLDIPFGAMKSAEPYNYLGNKKLFKILMEDMSEYYFMPVSNHEDWMRLINEKIKLDKK